MYKDEPCQGYQGQSVQERLGRKTARLVHMNSGQHCKKTEKQCSMPPRNLPRGAVGRHKVEHGAHETELQGHHTRDPKEGDSSRKKRSCKEMHIHEKEKS